MSAALHQPCPAHHQGNAKTQRPAQGQDDLVEEVLQAAMELVLHVPRTSHVSGQLIPWLEEEQPLLVVVAHPAPPNPQGM